MAPARRAVPPAIDANVLAADAVAAVPIDEERLMKFPAPGTKLLLAKFIFGPGGDICPPFGSIVDALGGDGGSRALWSLNWEAEMLLLGVASVGSLALAERSICKKLIYIESVHLLFVVSKLTMCLISYLGNYQFYIHKVDTFLALCTYYRILCKHIDIVYI